ncbi:amino acid adenylation domain-containing protein, partial [Actinopolyspora alba]
MIERETDETERPRTPRAEEIRAAVAARLGIPISDIGAEDDLTELGLDSLGVMNLASTWQAAGVEVTFGELIEEATIAAWARLMDRSGSPDREAPEPADDEAFELAPMQHAYWSGRQPGMPLRTGSHFYFEFDTYLDPDRLDAAVSALRERHPMLRTGIDDDGVQHVHPARHGLDEVVDLRALDADTTEQRLARMRARMSHQTLRIAEGQGLDVRLVRLAEDACRLFLDIDMIVCDARSFGIVVSDLARLYAANSADTPPVDLDFRDYLRLVAQSGRGRRDRDAEYWRSRAESLPTAPSLPLATAPERLDEVASVRRHTWLSGDAYAQLAEHARAHGVTPSMALATAYADVLAAWSDDPHFLLNLPVFNRAPVHPDVEHLVGDFTDLQLLEVRPDGSLPFAERARAVQDQYRRDAAHSSYGGTSVLRDLARTTTGPGNRSGVVFTSVLGMGELFDRSALDLLGQPVWMSSQTPGVWIDLQLIEQDGGVLINWETAENLFSAGVPAAMFEAFAERARSLASDPDSWSRTLPVPLPVGQAEVRARVNDTGPGNPPRLLHPPIFTHAHTHPDRIAVHGHDHTLTYHQLTQQALAIAGHLRSRGIAHGDPVAVSIPKGPDQITAVLGILAAGACYVPIGIDQPPHRRNRILTSAHAHHALITTTPDPDWPHTTEPIDLTTATHAEPLPQPAQPSPHELAYIIYTSGSTGDPKGVEITHAAAANTIDAINHRYTIGPHDHVLAISALDFDLSVYDIFGLLTAGGHITTITENTRREPTHWAHLIQQHHITIWNTVPTLLDMLLTTTDTHQLPSLTLAMTSGDWIGLDLKDRLTTTAPNAHLAALGGATEAAIWSNVYDVTHIDPTWVSIPYGHPLPGQHYRVVNPHGHDCPDWVPGELWIGGAGLAHGYRNDPHKTNTSFITTNNQRWYRTGDQGRYHPDGTLEFLGRTDHQVKIRGHRIELGEIE